jgi:hypothetical protein
MGGTADPTGQVDGTSTVNAKTLRGHMGSDWVVSGLNIEDYRLLQEPNCL